MNNNETIVKSQGNLQNNKNEIPDWPCQDCVFWVKFFDTFDYTYHEYCAHPCRFNPNFPDWCCTFGSEFKPKTTLSIL